MRAPCPRGAPSPTALLPTQFRERARQSHWRPPRAPRLSVSPGCHSPRAGTPVPTRPLPATAAGGATGAAAGRRARRAARGQSCGCGRSAAAGAASHAPGALALPLPALGLPLARSPVRSPPPLAPRAHNEAAGREVVPAAASAPLPQPMPPPAEHLALGWEGGPGGRGLGPGLDLGGWGQGQSGERSPPRGPGALRLAPGGDLAVPPQ